MSHLLSKELKAEVRINAARVGYLENNNCIQW
jgi:hypothetical protein